MSRSYKSAVFVPPNFEVSPHMSTLLLPYIHFELDDQPLPLFLFLNQCSVYVLCVCMRVCVCVYSKLACSNMVVLKVSLFRECGQ